MSETSECAYCTVRALCSSQSCGFARICSRSSSTGMFDSSRRIGGFGVVMCGVGPGPYGDFWIPSKCWSSTLHLLDQAARGGLVWTNGLKVSLDVELRQQLVAARVEWTIAEQEAVNAF